MCVREGCRLVPGACKPAIIVQEYFAFQRDLMLTKYLPIQGSYEFVRSCLPYFILLAWLRYWLRKFAVSVLAVCRSCCSGC